ncbi:RES family NAD+ phosphorylase [Parathalassolituus penaei]|uniref:RES family NAD+ phosphorylase n=1 Tax=Parathalassolituus penaei TaxID=2997323 RepID=A0A9X3ISB4_9GAMM|nr:RES family NAD+ phosphorylase [Parathalassolituus penaei]MCY0963968.1 RES family NAD+ phosphorylase [Parathalassolituus penaei]
MLDGVEKLRPSWKHYRVVHSKYPPENLFDEDDETNFLLGELESLTSERIHNWRSFIHPDDFRHGSGWGAVMASFCYPRAGRFSTDEQGSYYCASSEVAALREWAHHVQRFWHDDMKFSDDASATVRCYTGNFEQPLLDVRDMAEAHTVDDYGVSQALAALARQRHEHGILYRSVRSPGDECAALLRPSASTAVTQSCHYTLIFDGRRFVSFARLGEFRQL